MRMITEVFSPRSLVMNRIGSIMTSSTDLQLNGLQSKTPEERGVQEVLLVVGGGYLKDREEGLLRDVHLADAFHALFAFFLFFEEFAFARDVAAVALGQHIFANGGDGFARDHAAANGGLNGHVEHLPWN